MKNLQRLLALFLLFSLLLVELTGQVVDTPKYVDKVEISGAKKTNERFVRHQFFLNKGIITSEADVEAGIQRLHNLGIFYDLAVEKVQQNDSLILKIDLREKITTLPIVNFGGVEDNFWFRLGAMDVNFLGRGALLGLYYTYYERHSFNLFFEMPYVGYSNYGYKINFQKWSTEEPVYFKGSSADYNYDNITIELLGRYQLASDIHLYSGITFLHEKYERLSNDQFLPDYPTIVEKNKWISKSRLVINTADHFFNYLSGIQNETFLEFVIKSADTEFFWKIINEFKCFHRLGKSGNLASRLRLGISRDVESPFVPFVLDSYVNIRGAGNRVARGIGELVWNIEYRHNIHFDRDWGAIQAVSFLDLGSWQPIGAPLSALFDEENTSVFAGLGLRIYFKKVYNMTLRADYGIDVRFGDSQGIVLGIGQYF